MTWSRKSHGFPWRSAAFPMMARVPFDMARQTLPLFRQPLGGDRDSKYDWLDRI